MEPARVAGAVPEVALRSKIPAPVQQSLQSKLAQLEEIRKKRLELEQLLLGGGQSSAAAPPPQKGKAPGTNASSSAVAVPLGTNTNAQNVPPSRLPVPHVSLDHKSENAPVPVVAVALPPSNLILPPEPLDVVGSASSSLAATGSGTVVVVSPALSIEEPVAVIPVTLEPESASHIQELKEQPQAEPTTALPGTTLLFEPPVPAHAPPAPARPTKAVAPTISELPKPMDIATLANLPSAAGRSNARVRAQPHEQTPYHSRSLRLRALAAAATPEPLPAAKPKTAAEKADEWGAATRKNTQANKGHHAKLIITLVHKEGPRPPSPSQALREKKFDFNAPKASQADDEALYAEQHKPLPNGKKKVRWTANEIIDETQPRQPTAVRSTASTKTLAASAKPIVPVASHIGAATNSGSVKPCIRRKGDTESDSRTLQLPQSPPIVTIQRFVFVEVAPPPPPAQVGTGSKRKKT